MTFPVVFHVLGLNLSAHLVFEMLAYFIGFRFYLWLRRRAPDVIDDAGRLTALIGAVLGAAIGSKIMGFAEHPPLWRMVAHNPMALIAAKSIWGALLGGIIGVEIAKKIAGITRSTGDLYVFPLILGMMIGRIGCLLTGVEDGTWGLPTHFFMGFDAGDGIIRHPTPLYEIIALGGMAGGLFAVKRKVRLREGDLFKLFIILYGLWRLGVEFIKPVTVYSLSGNSLNIVQVSVMNSVQGLSVLQMSALVAMVYYASILALRRAGSYGNA